MAIRRLGVLLALAILVAACSEGEGNGGQLEGTTWVLDSYQQDGALTILPETLYADVEFRSSRVTGFSGCNTFNALYRAGGRTLFITGASSTLMACDEEAMDFEQAYLGLLDSSRFYGVHRGRLTIYNAAREAVLVFDAAPRNPLLGPWTVTSYGTDPGTQVAVPEGTEIDIAFRIASVGGFSGCNSFTGVYGTNGTVLRVGPLATTRVACDEDVMDQETAFLAALQGVAVIESRGSILNLTDRAGSILVALERPAPEPGASAPPSAEPTIEPTEEPTASPTEEPTPTPTPTPSPTTAPTATPAATASPAPLPSLSPPPEATVASCDLAVVDGPVVAAITYPGSWSTVTEPADLACRFFDPEPISVPADPEALDTAIEADVAATPYADAVAAATDPDSWTVTSTTTGEVGDVPVTCVGATALTAAGGLPAGTASYACLADVGTAGTIVIGTTGEPDDRTFESDAAIVALMTQATTFTPVP